MFMPVSGRSATRGTLIQAARLAEEWGFGSIWAADRIVIPWQIDTAYPYAEDAAFIVPPDRPFLEPLTTLAFLAGATETIKLGISVLVMPYRHPVYWAKIVSTIDVLAEGRFILGVGVGWMEEEFNALGAPFKERGAVADEQLELLNVLWGQEHCDFAGRYFQVNNIAFYPKSFNEDGIPVWVGGEGKRAQRRAAAYGDSWFPYFVHVTADELLERFDNVRALAADHGRNPAEVSLNCCLPIEVTDQPSPQSPDQLRGSPEQLAEALRRFEAVGVETLALQFMVRRYPDRLEQIQRFSEEVLPEFQARPAAL